MGNKRGRSIKEIRKFNQILPRQFGEKIICDNPGIYGESKSYTDIIWATHYDNKNNVAGFNGLAFAKIIKPVISDFYTSPNKFTKTRRNLLQQDTEWRISGSTISSLPIASFNTNKENLEILKSRFVPDLIARRAQSIVFNPSQLNYCRIDFSKVARTEGILFNSITPDMVKSGPHPADVPGRTDTAHIQYEMPHNLNLTQDDVDHITDWAIARGNYCKRRGLSFNKIWPESGTWPNWRDIKDENGNMIPCISSERKKELLAEPEVITPKVTDNTKLTAARVHAQKFASFKL